MIIAGKAPLLSSKIYSISEKLWKVALFGPDNYRSAVISHYLYTKRKSLKKKAIEYAKELLEGYLEEEVTSQVAEGGSTIYYQF